MNIRQQLQTESLKNASLLSPAKKIQIAFELSRLAIALREAVQAKEDHDKKSRKRLRRPRQDAPRGEKAW